MSDYKSVRAMFSSVENKLYFAGDLYIDGSGWTTVDAAEAAARKTVEKLVGTI